MNKSPSRRLPAEWEKQRATLLSWPRANAGWGERLAETEVAYAHFVRSILKYQDVIICVEDRAQEQRCLELVSPDAAHNSLHTILIHCNDSWTRDFGPITVLEHGSPRHLDFIFNGWGEKYPATDDNRVNNLLFQRGLLGELQPIPVVLEGGSIDSNGAGTLITTSRCLLEPHRNPDFSREDYEALFREQMGIQHTLWLDHGWLAGDDTDGHIDMLVRFANENTLLYTQCTHRDDKHFEPLAAMEQQLKTFRDQKGEPYTLIPLPLPSPRYSTDGDRLAASYANFLILNDAVICPVYACEEDTLAIKTLADCFPTRTIEAVDARSFITQGGSLHCLSMQLPR